MKTMNQNDKIHFLGELLEENEVYQAEIWGTIMADSKTMFGLGALATVIGSTAATLGALSNDYCYIGLTPKSINFVIVGSFDASEIKGSFRILRNEIENVKVKSSIIPGRKVVIIQCRGGKIKLSLVKNTIGSDLKDQKEGVDIFCDQLKHS